MSWLLLVLVGASLLPSAVAVRCFCNDGECATAGFCDASACVVGVVDAELKIVQTCAPDPYTIDNETPVAVGCLRNVERFSAVCTCTKSLCNTVDFKNGPRRFSYK